MKNWWVKLFNIISFKNYKYYEINLFLFPVFGTYTSIYICVNSLQCLYKCSVYTNTVYSRHFISRSNLDIIRLYSFFIIFVLFLSLSFFQLLILFSFIIFILFILSLSCYLFLLDYSILHTLFVFMYAVYCNCFFFIFVYNLLFFLSFYTIIFIYSIQYNTLNNKGWKSPYRGRSGELINSGERY